MEMPLILVGHPAAGAALSWAIMISPVFLRTIQTSIRVAEQACLLDSPMCFEQDPDPQRPRQPLKFLGNLPVRLRTNDFVSRSTPPRRRAD